MRKIIILISSLYISLAFAFEINGTNVIFRFENTLLNETTKEIIHTDLLRRIAPTLNRASIQCTIIDNIKTYRIERLSFNSPTPLSSCESPSRILTKEGTNFIMRISNTLVSIYEPYIQLYNANTNAIAKAWAFADFLNNADIQNMSTNEIKSLRLIKGYNSNTFTDTEIEEIKEDLLGWTFFPPSIAEFQMIKCGPNNSTYLWGIIPCKRDDNDIDCFPIVYINDKWMISFWMYEESLLGM